MADWYIRPDGNDANAGTSDSTGGAFKTFAPVSAGGGAAVAAGDTVHVKGAGSDTPLSADYTISASVEVAHGTPTAFVSIIGFNGRPRIHGGGQLFTLYNNRFENLFLFPTGTSLGGVIMANNGLASSTSELEDCVVDQNGYNLWGTDAATVIGSRFQNSNGGGFVPGTKSDTDAPYTVPAAINGNASEPSYSNFGSIYGNIIDGWLGSGIAHPNCSSIIDNFILNCSWFGIDDGIYFAKIIARNTIDGCGTSGIRLASHDANGGAYTLRSDVIRNNVITHCGAHGIYLDATLAASRTAGHVADYNAFGFNALGDYGNIDAGAHDVSLTQDPYVDRAGKNYRLNAYGRAMLVGKRWPTHYRGITP